MYSVFLVDDEHIVLEGIRNKIDWENSGFSFAGEATDGELALSMIHDIKPDILITDIKMPFMDGLELSRLLKKSQPWIRIIILSGHDEFNYAKEAISIGVDEYILKPFTHEDILASLNKVAENLNKEHKQVSDINRLKEELKSNTVLIKNKFLTDLTLGNLDNKNILPKAAELGLDLLSLNYRIIITKLLPKNQDTNNLTEPRSRLLSYTGNWNESISFFISPEFFVSIVKNNSTEQLMDNVYNVAEAINHLVIQDEKCSAFSVIGKNVMHLSEIVESYDDAKRTLGMSHFTGKSLILNADDAKASCTEQISLNSSDPLSDRLKYAGPDEINKILNEYREMFKSNQNQFSVIASYLSVDIIKSISKYIEILGGDINEVMPEILQTSFVENLLTSEETFLSEIERVFKSVLEYRDSKIQGRYGDIILKAKEYMEQNFANQNTCLTAVAEEVHLSPNHFSTIFSQECGVTFIEYLTDIRIENAKKLLRDTDLKGYDIAYECGFSDPHYFSFIFKKTTGLTPREFKNSINPVN